MNLWDPNDNKVILGLAVATVGAVLSLGFIIWLARVLG
jgi:hypothetical protein